MRGCHACEANGSRSRAGAAPDRRRARPVRHRLRQRRLVDLLRARARRRPRARAHAGGLHLRRRAVRAHRQDVRRGRVDVPRGRRLVVVRPPRLQRGRLVLRRLGADARLHHHDRDQRVLRAALPGRVLPGAAPQPGRHHRRRGRDRAARRAQHPRARRVGQAEHLPRGRRPRHPGRRSSCSARCWCSTRRCSSTRCTSATAPSYTRADLRALDLDGRLHRHRDGLEHGRGGARPRPRRAARRSTTC